MKKCLVINMDKPKTGKTTASVIRAIGEILEAGGREMFIESPFWSVTTIQELFQRITALLSISLEYRIEDGMLFVRSKRPDQLKEQLSEEEFSQYLTSNGNTWIHNREKSIVRFEHCGINQYGDKEITFENLDRPAPFGGFERRKLKKKHFFKLYGPQFSVCTTIR